MTWRSRLYSNGADGTESGEPRRGTFGHGVHVIEMIIILGAEKLSGFIDAL